MVINPSTTYAGVQGPSASAYVTYLHNNDALRAIQSVNNITIDSRQIKTSLGTTKYCSHFMKNQQCPKPDCMYLHELGDGEASFTKEEMHQGKHQEYEKRLHDALIAQTAAMINGGGGVAGAAAGTNGVAAAVEGSSSSSPVLMHTHVRTTSGGSGGGGDGDALLAKHGGNRIPNKEAWPSLMEGPVPKEGKLTRSGNKENSVTNRNNTEKSSKASQLKKGKNKNQHNAVVNSKKVARNRNNSSSASNQNGSSNEASNQKHLVELNNHNNNNCNSNGNTSIKNDTQSKIQKLSKGNFNNASDHQIQRTIASKHNATKSGAGARNSKTLQNPSMDSSGTTAAATATTLTSTEVKLKKTSDDLVEFGVGEDSYSLNDDDAEDLDESLLDPASDVDEEEDEIDDDVEDDCDEDDADLEDDCEDDDDSPLSLDSSRSPASSTSNMSRTVSESDASDKLSARSLLTNHQDYSGQVVKMADAQEDKCKTNSFPDHPHQNLSPSSTSSYSTPSSLSNDGLTMSSSGDPSPIVTAGLRDKLIAAAAATATTTTPAGMSNPMMSDCQKLQQQQQQQLTVNDAQQRLSKLRFYDDKSSAFSNTATIGGGSGGEAAHPMVTSVADTFRPYIHSNDLNDATSTSVGGDFYQSKFDYLQQQLVTSNPQLPDLLNGEWNLWAFCG